jgi:hypothetical protein
MDEEENLVEKPGICDHIIDDLRTVYEEES